VHVRGVLFSLSPHAVAGSNSLLSLHLPYLRLEQGVHDVAHIVHARQGVAPVRLVDGVARENGRERGSRGGGGRGARRAAAGRGAAAGGGGGRRLEVWGVFSC
jgi:hypothetical protein